MGSGEYRTFCRLCTAGCGVVVSIDGENVLTVRGDEAHPVSRGYTCVKGRSLGLAHHDPARLNAPLIRRGGEFVEVGWTEWLDDLANRLSPLIETAGPSAVGGFYSGGSYFDSSGHWVGQMFLSALGTRSIYSSYTIDAPNKPLVAELVGGSVRLAPLPDLGGTRCLLVMATNPVISHGHGIAMPNPVVQLRAVRARGELWVLDPRNTETTQVATRHLRPLPGTDYAVLGFLIRELLQQGADREYIEEFVEGVEDLARAVQQFSLHLVSDLTGITCDDLTDLIAAVRRAGRVSALTGTGASMSTTANVLEWFSWALGIITGSYDRPGGTWFNPGFFRQNDRLAFDPAPTDGNVTAGPSSRPELCGRNRQLPAIAIPDEVAAGNLRALFALGANLVAAIPGTPSVVDALRKLDVLAVADVVYNETVEIATHVAPCAGQLERPDLSTSSEIYQDRVIGQYTKAVVPMGANRKPLWWIMAQVGQRLGLSVLPRDVNPSSATTTDVLAELAASARLPFDEVVDAGGPVCAERGPVFGWVLQGAVLPNGRWRVAPPILVDQLSRTCHEAPRQSLLLIPRRERRQMNGYLRFLQLGTRPEVIISATDAEAASIGDGDRVTVRSDHGEMDAVAKVDSTMLVGAVSVPHGWVAPSVNSLMSGDDHVDEHTGMPLMSGLPVTVTNACVEGRSSTVGKAGPGGDGDPNIASPSHEDTA
jgi:anaerobic selenocysteine-containing dehydrogenase